MSYGIAASSAANPSFAEQIAFALSAVAAFSPLNLVVAYLAGRERGSLRSKRILLVASATNFLAVGAGLCVAFAIGLAVSGFAAWMLIPFGAGLSYMLVQAVELALARDVDET